MDLNFNNRSDSKTPKGQILKRQRPFSNTTFFTARVSTIFFSEDLSFVQNMGMGVNRTMQIYLYLNQVEMLNKNVPNSKLEIFKGCCHNVHLEKPENFNKTIKNFLE